MSSRSIPVEQKDCLNTIRFLAALEVLYGHSFVHLQIKEVPILGDVVHFFSGVPIFFSLSGFLIWWSIARSKSYAEYLKKRFWRIYPELWVAVLVELIVLIFLFKGPVDWPQFGAFAFTQGTIFQFWTPDCLREYGCGCPNGALWTICVLIQFYLFAYSIFKGLHGRKLWIWLVSIGASIAISYFSPTCIRHFPEIIGKLYSQTLIPYLWIFLCAALVAEKKDVTIDHLKKYWWIYISALIVIRYLVRWDITAGYNVIGTVLLFLGLVGFAYRFPGINIKTDISYGMYIYHMTVVNALITLGFMHSIWHFFIVLTMTCLLAWISTETIGRLSRKMKQKTIVQG